MSSSFQAQVNNIEAYPQKQYISIDTDQSIWMPINFWSFRVAETSVGKIQSEGCSAGEESDIYILLTSLSLGF